MIHQIMIYFCIDKTSGQGSVGTQLLTAEGVSRPVGDLRSQPCSHYMAAEAPLGNVAIVSTTKKL
jgi:hypothetical protein